MLDSLRAIASERPKANLRGLKAEKCSCQWRLRPLDALTKHLIFRVFDHCLRHKHNGGKKIDWIPWRDPRNQGCMQGSPPRNRTLSPRETLENRGVRRMGETTFSGPPEETLENRGVRRFDQQSVRQVLPGEALENRGVRREQVDAMRSYRLGRPSKTGVYVGLVHVA